MNKETYLRELARLLKRLPVEEREEALRWHEEYFAEAGEEKALEELGTPEEAAREIVSKMALDEGRGKRRPGWWALVTMAFPVGAPIAAALFAVIIALIVALAAVLIALMASGGALALLAVANIAYVAVSGFSPLANAAFYLGNGLLLAGVGAALAYLSAVALRASVRGIRQAIVQRIVGRKQQ